MESANAPATDVETQSMLQKLEGLKNHLISMSCVDPEDVETQQNYELDAIDIIRGNPPPIGTRGAGRIQRNARRTVPAREAGSK